MLYLDLKTMESIAGVLKGSPQRCYYANADCLHRVIILVGFKEYDAIVTRTEDARANEIAFAERVRRAYVSREALLADRNRVRAVLRLNLCRTTHYKDNDARRHRAQYLFSKIVSDAFGGTMYLRCLDFFRHTFTLFVMSCRARNCGSQHGWPRQDGRDCGVRKRQRLCVLRLFPRPGRGKRRGGDDVVPRRRWWRRQH